MAVVEPGGRLHVSCKGHADSPSAAEKLACGGPQNGWRFWMQRPAWRRRLEAVRDELFSDQNDW